MRYFRSSLCLCPTLGGHVCRTADQRGHAADVCPRREAEEELCGGHPLSFANFQSNGGLVSHSKKGYCTQFKVLSMRKPILTPQMVPVLIQHSLGQLPCIIGSCEHVVDGGDIHWLLGPLGQPSHRERKDSSQPHSSPYVILKPPGCSVG